MKRLLITTVAAPAFAGVLLVILLSS